MGARLVTVADVFRRLSFVVICNTPRRNVTHQGAASPGFGARGAHAKVTGFLQEATVDSATEVL